MPKTDMLNPQHLQLAQLGAWKWSGDVSNGKTLATLHGIYDSAKCWTAFAKRMPEDWNVVAIDEDAHGSTPLLDGDFRMETLADQVVAALEDLAAGPVALIGHSMGGVVAHLVALQRPDLVSCLVLEEPGWQVAEFETNGNGFPKSMLERSRQLQTWSAGRLLIDGWQKTRLWDPLDAGAWLDAKLDVDVDFVNREHNWDTIATPESMADLKMPALLMAGSLKRGSLIPDSYVERAEKALGSLEFHRLDATHDSRKDQPDEYARIVSRFIDKAC